ncbi:oxidoreductase [Candidatus Parcubacteria bacterium]|mgnify:CR=1 FL=1|nr:MAG: oxidoreductase [Candidatus Parcubacteria bacterium]
MQRIAFLGCGRVTEHHTKFFTDGSIVGAQVTHVCDIDQEKANVIGGQLNAVVETDYNKLLQNPDIDVISILTESGNHGVHARQALEAGKHVIVEKPAALTPKEILDNEKLAAEKGLMYAVIKQNRFNPAVRTLKKAQEEGRFGKIVTGTIRLRWCRYQSYYEDGWHGTWKMDGGVINQQAIHHIDVLQWVCGPIDSVVCAQENAVNELEAEDTTVAVVRFKNGALGTIEATTAARPDDFEASVSIVGDGGSAVVGGIALNKIDLWHFVKEQEKDKTIPQNMSQEVPTGYGLSHGPFLQEIINELNSGGIMPPVTGSDAVESVKIIHALYKSQEDGTWVKLDDNPISSNLGI